MLPDQAIVVTGASGYLAHRLVPKLAALRPVIGIARTAQGVHPAARQLALDLSESQAVETLAALKPTAIIHAAAGNPGVNTDAMVGSNYRASLHVAQAARRCECRAIMVSTDVVHGGDSAPYTDAADPTPVNDYGRTKARGEAAFLKVNPDNTIVRTSLIYGLDQMDRGTSGFQARLQSGATLSLFEDVWRQPVWIESLVDALIDLALRSRPINGFINVAGMQVLSRAEFGMALLDYWGIDPADKLNLISGAGMAGLPLDLRLDCRKALSLGYLLPGVSAVLEAYAAAR